MVRPFQPRTGSRTAAETADCAELESVISLALAATPIDEDRLRLSVWNYVSAERHTGTPAGIVLVSLTELVDLAPIEPGLAREPLMRRVILWCVEAYFGHLGGAEVGRNGPALPHSAS